MTSAIRTMRSVGAGAGIVRLALTGLLLTTAFGAFVVAATGAIFTDTESVSANSFSTGPLDISTSPASAVVAFPSMVPGDEVVESLDVSNDGSLELRYAVRSVTSEDVLASQIELSIKSGVTTCDVSGFGVDGDVLYTGILGSIAGQNVIGDPAQGQDAGDRVLSAASSEELCVKVELPRSTGNAHQGQTTDATFTVYAEQTANNS